MIGAGAAIGAAVGLGKAVMGGVQARKAKKALENLERPTYEVPEGIKQNLSQAKLDALEGLPAEQKQQAINNMNRTMAAGLASGASRKGGLAGVGGAMQAQTDAFSGMISADAVARQQNKQGLAQANTAMAGYEDQAFQMNEMDPYNQELGALQGQSAAGQQTMYSGIDDIAGAASMGVGNAQLGSTATPGNIMPGVTGAAPGAPQAGAGLQIPGNQFFKPNNFSNVWRGVGQ